MASILQDNVLTRALSRISLRMYLLTWNVNGKPPPDDMEHLLQLSQLPPFDIYCIGLQEVSSYDWEGAFTDVLHTQNYVRVKSRKMQGIQTFLFVYRSLLPYVTNIESELTRTGFGGYWGNKGAASVRLDFMGVNIIIINCHLAAHREETMARIEDIDAIMDSQKFKDDDADNILDHDYIFWMGDMNFRLEELSRFRVVELIQKKAYKKLLQYDQLKMVMEENLVFDGFREGDITFAPTYKFDNGTDSYDTSSKQRVPAYTDRVLYFYHETEYGKDRLHAEVMNYMNHPLYKMSDHRPVSAEIAFHVPSRCIHAPVGFEMSNRRRHKEVDNVFLYKIRKDFSTAADDWIGLYRADFPHFDSYLKYQYVSHGKQLTSGDRQASITFKDSQLYTLRDGLYVLCYLRRKGSLCGISTPFMLSSSL